jgi:hypothetical protein
MILGRLLQVDGKSTDGLGCRLIKRPEPNTSLGATPAYIDFGSKLANK